jgi:hypothetical protein
MATEVRQSNAEMKSRFYTPLANSLNEKHPCIVDALQDLVRDTVIDGELVALETI